jgi:very-short-patch-repair endonuclease
VARVAAGQHGVITRAQLRGYGLDANAIDYRLRVGRLHPLHRAVYAVGHRPPSPHARAMAAVLACGPGAVLSHRSAGSLWGLGPRWGDRVDVTSARHVRQRRGIRVHESGTLTRRDITRHYGIPVTSLARTLLDLADVLNDTALTRAVNQARLQRRGVGAELAALIARSPGRVTTRLTPMLDHAPTRSTLEDDFLAFAARHRLPAPEVNQIIAGHEVDMLWRAHRLIVELDSRHHHEHRFEEDRDRDADLLTAGYPVLRITSRRLRLNPDREAARLRSTLAARAPAQ